MIKNLIFQKSKDITVEQLLKDLDKISGILVYSGKTYIGNIFYDPEDSPVSWYFLLGINFVDRESYDSIEDLLNYLTYPNINIKVIYNERKG